MRKLLPLSLGSLLGLLVLPGCRVVKPEVSVEGVPQACCGSADSKLQTFKGCRILPRGSCKSRHGEKFWMRGDIACGPVDEAQCEGGRCCKYRPQYDADLSEPVENWAPPGFDSPTNNVTDPDAPPQHDLPEPGAKKKVEPKPAKPAESTEPAEPDTTVDEATAPEIAPPEPATSDSAAR